MSAVGDLYSNVILDHYKNPRNYHKLPLANRQADGINPLCGDNLSIFIQVNDGIVVDISFTGTGCAISIASASMMTEHLKGKPESEVGNLFEQFHKLVANPTAPLPDVSKMGNLSVFMGIREYPVRAKCAFLAWHAMRAALDQTNSSTTTE